MGLELLTMLGVAKQITGWVTTQATLLNAQGQISDEDLAKIKDEAGVSDSNWDDAVAAARARLADS